MAPSTSRVSPSQGQGNRREGPSKCMKYAIFSFNVFFWLASVLVIAVGIALLAENRPVYSEYKDIAYDPAAVCTAFGCLLFVITFTGCLGALRENTCLLCTFSLLLGFVLLVEVSGVALGFYYRTEMKGKIEHRLKTAVEFYRDENKRDLQYLIDSTQSELKCCGVTSYSDWENNWYFNCSNPGYEACGVPFSCCKDTNNNRQCGRGVRSDSVDYGERISRIYTVGCVDVVINWFKDNLIVLAGVGTAALVMQIVNLFMAYTFRGQILDIKNSWSA